MARCIGRFSQLADPRGCLNGPLSTVRQGFEVEPRTATRVVGRRTQRMASDSMIVTPAVAAAATLTRVLATARACCATKVSSTAPKFDLLRRVLLASATAAGATQAMWRGPLQPLLDGVVAGGLDPVWWTSSERRLRCPHRWQRHGNGAGVSAGGSRMNSSSKRFA